MKIFRNIVEKYNVYKALYKQLKLDSYYRDIFLKTIREETADRNSEFVKNGFKLAEDEESLIAVVRVPLEVQQHGDEFLIQDKLWEQTFFMTDFLVKKAKFDSYVSQRPEFFHVEDPTSSDISLTYVARWEFVPVIAPSLKHKLYGYPILGAVLATVATVLGIIFI